MIDYDKLISQVVEKVVKGAQPQKIILFGSSQIPGSPTNDLDLFIVKPSKLRRDKRDIEIRKLLSDIVFPMDIFVYTPEEVKKHGSLPGSFINKILKTGKTLYESE